MTENKRLVLTGATGELGTALAPALMAHGYDLVVFARDLDAAQRKLPGAAAYARWEIGLDGDWKQLLDGAYGVINCAGANMFARRYTKAYARVCAESRVLGARALVDALRAAGRRPEVFINTASQGYYGLTDFDDRPLDESAPPGLDKWGQESAPIDAEPFAAQTLGVRVVSVRAGYVLDCRGGGLPLMVAQVLKGQGAATTPVTAWRSWIHIDDLVAMYLWALADPRVNGGLNGTAPNPVTSANFANALSLAVTGQPTTRRFPGFLLRLFMGPAATVITHGKRIIPRKAQDLGFQFTFPTLEQALADLVPKIKPRPV